MTRPNEPTRLGEFSKADCPCAGRLFWRPVLRRYEHTDDAAGAVACMRCGWVRVEHVYLDWDGPDQHSLRPLGFADEELDDDVREWVGQWPRVAWPGYDVAPHGKHYLPAATRASTTDELVAIEDMIRLRDAALADAERFEAAGGAPKEPPPAGLPPELAYLRETWERL